VHAKKLLGFEDLAGFKQDRAAIIAYLEPQYQRLVLASNSITTFIKSQNHHNCLFEADTRGKSMFKVDIDAGIPSEAVILLEEFATAFRRDVTPEVAIRIKMMQLDFDRI
jgi:hypothetical protein